MRAKGDDYMGSMPYLDGLTHLQLIQMVADLYNKMKGVRTWIVQSAEEDNIIALIAELREVNGALVSPSHCLRS